MLDVFLRRRDKMRVPASQPPRQEDADLLTLVYVGYEGVLRLDYSSYQRGCFKRLVKKGLLVYTRIPFGRDRHTLRRTPEGDQEVLKNLAHAIHLFARIDERGAANLVDCLNVANLPQFLSHENARLRKAALEQLRKLKT